MVGYFQLGVFVKTNPLEQSHCLDASRFGVLEKTICWLTTSLDVFMQNCP